MIEEATSGITALGQPAYSGVARQTDAFSTASMPRSGACPVE
jgi:hypothetical protein